MELHEFLDNQEETEKEYFKVTDKDTANWALRKIKQYQEKQKENSELADAEKEKINAWLEAENGQAQQSVDFFQGLLAEYAMKQREIDPKFKSMNLPNGKIQFRKQQPKWNYDANKVIESLKRLGMTDYIRFKEEPAKSDIKKALQVAGNKVVNPETGEIVEGITIEERGESFSVKINE